MSLQVVGVADCGWSTAPGEILVTYALGSCIAVAIHDPVARVGGLLHYMLPEASLDRGKAALNPFMFADTGIPTLFEKAYQLGAQKNRLVTHVAGGAQVMGDNGVFNIGRRNYLALRKILWKAGVLVHAEDVGGTASRTVRLDVATGRFLMRDGNGTERELGRAATEQCRPRPGGTAWRSR